MKDIAGRSLDVAAGAQIFFGNNREEDVALLVSLRHHWAVPRGAAPAPTITGNRVRESDSAARWNPAVAPAGYEDEGSSALKPAPVGAPSGMTRMDNPYLHHLTLEQLGQPVPHVEEGDDASQVRIDEMLRLMREARLPALAAPQAGLRRRVVAVDLSRTGRSPIVLVDPVVDWAAGEQQSDLEGCLSLPDIRVRVARPVQVVVRAHSRNGQVLRIHAGGLLARILQHKIDHLNGISLLDHLTLTPSEQNALGCRLRLDRPRCSIPA